jgi:hypothetical protein
MLAGSSKPKPINHPSKAKSNRWAKQKMRTRITPTVKGKRRSDLENQAQVHRHPCIRLAGSAVNRSALSTAADDVANYTQKMHGRRRC